MPDAFSLLFISFLPFGSMSHADRTVLLTSLRKSGLTDAQVQSLGARLVLLQASDDILRGEEILLPYFRDAAAPPDAADFLWHYGFVPKVPKDL